MCSLRCLSFGFIYFCLSYVASFASESVTCSVFGFAARTQTKKKNEDRLTIAASSMHCLFCLFIRFCLRVYADTHPWSMQYWAPIKMRKRRNGILFPPPAGPLHQPGRGGDWLRNARRYSLTPAQYTGLVHYTDSWQYLLSTDWRYENLPIVYNALVL